VKRSARSLFVARFIRSLILVFVSGSVVHAQELPARLVTGVVDESERVTLRGTVHPLAVAANDRGPVPDSLAAQRMLLILNRPPDREAALQQFLSAAHTKGSAGYHKWVTSEQFGAQFGPADDDVQTASSWLSSHGFSVARVTKSKRYIEFSGTAGQLREAFHTQIEQYTIGSEVHYANATELSIPAALAPLVRGVSPLNNFRAKPQIQVAGQALYSRKTKKTTPLFTLPNTFGTSNPNIYAVAPEDFATQYDLAPLYAAGVNGTGQTIGIINESNIDVSVVNDYRQLFNLSSNPPQLVIDGDDPGTLSQIDVEAYLDVEVSGAVATNATVNLYISGGSNLQDPLALAALRAIEDNQASVLSVSFGSCEFQLGLSGNALWFSLWEQAAAEGQTVFVSSGDSGSECLLDIGPSVSGIASTPWNIAVGGTDFYYSDFATGGASATTLWNATNDANLGSLKAPLTEQVWNDPFGLDIIGDGLERNEFGAGGGGVSDCAVATGGSATCTSGYPKPSWQTGPGVPPDAARDLPDVSLFASNGANLSAYPICAEAGDCAPGTGAEAQIFLVGGTSASSPAMAGIMSLVVQKYGRQGQANFTLYPLAQQKPAAFHDTTLGNNDEICNTTTECTNGVTPVYSAGPGFDLASGLGSVDANVLVNDWNSITFQATSTSLRISPANITHGSPLTVTTKVAPSTGTGTPSGSVAIVTNSSTISSHGQASIPLNSGSGSSSIDFLPGGSYQVTAQYSGDGIFASSTSSPVTLNVKPEASVINFAAFQGVAPITSTNNQTVFYGQPVTLSIQPTGLKDSPSTTDVFATGSSTFTMDSAMATVPLNATGIANWSTPALSVGSHSASAAYSGDASFEASSATPITFMVAKGKPVINDFPSVPQGNAGPGSATVSAGGSLTVSIVVGPTFETVIAGGSSVPGTMAPTGTVQVCLSPDQLGGGGCFQPKYSQTVTLAAPTGSNSQNSSVTVTFPNLAAGFYLISAVYNGDANWNSGGLIDLDGINVVAPSASLHATTTTLTITPSSISGSQLATVTATVTGAAGSTLPPTGTVSLYDNNASSAFFFLNEISPTPTGASASFKAEYSTAFFWSNGANQITAVYSGDANYQTSTSGVASVTVAQVGDFSLAPQLAQITVASGSSATAGLNMGSLSAGDENVSLSCATSSAAITCSMNPSSVTVNEGGASTLTVNAFIPAQTARLQGPLFKVRYGGLVMTGVSMIGFVLLLTCARRRRKFAFAAAGGLFAILAFQVACGGGGGGTVTPPPPGNTPAPPGTYSVLVTATANGVVHNAKIAVVVK
jgi:subtilase family serine protease